MDCKVFIRGFYNRIRKKKTPNPSKIEGQGS